MFWTICKKHDIKYRSNLVQCPICEEETESSYGYCQEIEERPKRASLRTRINSAPPKQLDTKRDRHTTYASAWWQLTHQKRYHAYIKHYKMFDSDAPEISDLETLDLPDGMVLIWAVVKLDECQPDIKVIIPVSREILGDAELIDEIIPEMLFDAARAYLAEMTDGQIDNESTRPRTLPMHDNCPLSTL